MSYRSSAFSMTSMFVVDVLCLIGHKILIRSVVPSRRGLSPTRLSDQVHLWWTIRRSTPEGHCDFGVRCSEFVASLVVAWIGSIPVSFGLAG